MKWNRVWVFLEPALAFFIGIEIVEDDVKLPIGEGRVNAVQGSRETRYCHRRLKFAAMMRPVGTSSAANKVVVSCRLYSWL